MQLIKNAFLKTLLFFPIAWVCCYVGSPIGMALLPPHSGGDVLGILVGLVVAVIVTWNLPLRRRSPDASLEMALRD